VPQFDAQITDITEPTGDAEPQISNVQEDSVTEESNE